MEELETKTETFSRTEQFLIPQSHPIEKFYGRWEMFLKRKTTATLTEVTTLTVTFKISCSLQVVILPEPELFQGTIFYSIRTRFLPYKMLT